MHIFGGLWFFRFLFGFDGVAWRVGKTEGWDAGGGRRGVEENIMVGGMARSTGWRDLLMQKYWCSVSATVDYFLLTKTPRSR